MKFYIFILCFAFANCNLQSLINFAGGRGLNPTGGGQRSAGPLRQGGAGVRPAFGAGAQQPVAARPRQRTPIESPIPFAEPADPSRGVVALNVPQPKPSAHQPAALNRQSLVEASSPPRFAGLPAGSTQVGGRTVSLATTQRKRPAPLSEIHAPIFMSEDFRNPLNDVNPFSAALPEPVEALQHRFLPGNRPQPLHVQNQNLAVIMALTNPVLQQGIRTQDVDYDRLTGEIFNQGDVQYGQQQDQGRAQADLSHQDALTRHRQALDLALQQQHQPQQHHQHQQQNRFQPQQRPQFQPQQPQQQFQPQTNQQHSHGNSRLAIPGLNKQRLVLLIWMLDTCHTELAYFSYTMGQPGSSARFVHFTLPLGIQNIDFQPLFGTVKIREGGLYQISYSLRSAGMNNLHAVLYKGSRVTNPSRLGISGCVATPPTSCTGNIVVSLHAEDVLRLEIEQGLVAVDNSTGFNTFSGYLIQTAVAPAQQEVSRECRGSYYPPQDQANNINTNQMPPKYMMKPYHSTNSYLPPSSGLNPPPGGQIKPSGGQLKPPGSTLPGNRPGFVGPPAPPPEVRFPGNRPGVNYGRIPYYPENNMVEQGTTRPPYYPTQRPSYYTSTNRPDYVAQPPIDSYGVPIAPPLDSYGVPEAPPINSYGVPEAPPLDSYGAPESPPLDNYGSTSNYVSQPENDNYIPAATPIITKQPKSENNPDDECCDVLRVRRGTSCCDGISGIYARIGVWQGKPLYKHVTNNSFVFWFDQNDWIGWIIGENIGDLEVSSLSTRRQTQESGSCPNQNQNGWQYFNDDKDVFVLDSEVRVECEQQIRNSRNIHFHTHLHSYPRENNNERSIPYYSIRADNQIVEAKFVYPNQNKEETIVIAKNSTN